MGKRALGTVFGVYNLSYSVSALFYTLLSSSRMKLNSMASKGFGL